MTREAAAAREPGGPSGPDDRINMSPVILQRVDRVEQRVDHLQQRLERFEDRVDARFNALDAGVEGLRRDLAGMNSRMMGLLLVLLLVAVFAKLFLPHP